MRVNLPRDQMWGGNLFAPNWSDCIYFSNDKCINGCDQQEAFLLFNGCMVNGELSLNSGKSAGMTLEYQSYAQDEKELIRQASTGSLEAFNELVLRYQNMAYYHACALLGDPASAEDITQESFIKAYKNIGRFYGNSFRAWLLKIVTNSAYDLLRQIRRHHTLPLFIKNEYGEESESHEWLIDPDASVEEIVERNESSRHLHRMLDELPAIYRSVLILVDIYELDYSEVSEALKIPIGTVKSRLARARLQMRRKLQNHNLRILNPAVNQHLAY